MAEPTKTTAPDWEAIERDYCQGLMSVRELGRMHGVADTSLRDMARRRKWARSVEHKVINAATVAAMAVDPITGQISARPKVVADATQRTADVIVGHRKDLAELGDLERELAKRLKGTQMAVSDQARTLKALSDARSKRILVEREVWGLANFKSESDIENALRSEADKLTVDQLAQMLKVLDAG